MFMKQYGMTLEQAHEMAGRVMQAESNWDAIYNDRPVQPTVDQHSEDAMFSQLQKLSAKIPLYPQPTVSDVARGSSVGKRSY